MSEFKIELGSKARCRITGFTGIVVCKAKWLYDCIRYTVQPQDLKDGKLIEPYTFDEDQLEVLEAAPPSVKGITGGPKDAPTRQADATR